jgi:formylglycine-generating enzyme required for sulfatase activity
MIALVLAAIAIGPGIYRPTFPASPSEAAVPVAKFWIDRDLVTNAEFLAFTLQHPEWRRDRVKRIFADAEYLAQWGTAWRPNAPAVNVSWFAARAYCASRGGRLPVEKEWELAAMTSDPATEKQLLAWYAETTHELQDVGHTTNALGVRDAVGLVWEWIEDFNAALVTADSRSTGDMFCGGAGAKSQDPTAYASFMRLAFRSSLEARFTLPVLGFRCAYDKEPS